MHLCANLGRHNLGPGTSCGRWLCACRSEGESGEQALGFGPGPATTSWSLKAKRRPLRAPHFVNSPNRICPLRGLESENGFKSKIGQLRWSIFGLLEPQSWMRTWLEDCHLPNRVQELTLDGGSQSESQKGGTA